MRWLFDVLLVTIRNASILLLSIAVIIINPRIASSIPILQAIIGIYLLVAFINMIATFPIIISLLR